MGFYVGGTYAAVIQYPFNFAPLLLAAVYTQYTYYPAGWARACTFFYDCAKVNFFFTVKPNTKYSFRLFKHIHNIILYYHRDAYCVSSRVVVGFAQCFRLARAQYNNM